jgi:hypothetical protein
MLLWPGATVYRRVGPFRPARVLVKKRPQERDGAYRQCAPCPVTPRGSRRAGLAAGGAGASGGKMRRALPQPTTG